MTSNLSERLTELRRKTRLSRKDFEFRHNISRATLRSWEDGSRTPDVFKLETLSNIYKSYGLIFSSEWLSDGIGPDPISIKEKVNEDIHILKEISIFESFYPNAYVHHVMDDYMSPWISKGDYVGGVYVPDSTFNSLIGKICIVKTTDFGTLVRELKQGVDKDLYNLNSYSGSGSLSNVKIENASLLIWLRRRLDSINV